ncbi:uncharacterized protein RSE6_13661 [Rhynchosporium secalis]|uniref:Uncharacterized protein n=1 Tax=Rhynchosporium secalis TaxID=38038 RepID=A0A1E1MU62_RHYSE|nr:uncharacterized protein RSE6_13661 [Rhynchosporium secalis]
MATGQRIADWHFEVERADIDVFFFGYTDFSSN